MSDDFGTGSGHKHDPVSPFPRRITVVLGASVERLVGSFSAARSNGLIVEIEIYQEFRETTQQSGRPSELTPGKKRFQLQGGGAVFPIDDATYEVALSGEKLIASGYP